MSQAKLMTFANDPVLAISNAESLISGERIMAGDIGLWTRFAGGPVGKARPVVMLSGLGYSSWCWSELMAGISSRYLAISPDNRGTGRSDKPAGPYSIAQMAEDVVKLLDALHLPEADIIGHSMGGYIAQTVAIRHPARVRTLTLVGTTRGGPDTHPVPPATLAAWHANSHLSPAVYAEKTMPLSYATGWAERNPERFRAFLASRLEYPTPSTCWLAQYHASERHVTTGLDVSVIQCPTLVIHGTDDRVVPYENASKLVARLRHPKFVTLQNAGHLCFLEDPVGFSELILDHLTQTERSGS